MKYYIFFIYDGSKINTNLELKLMAYYKSFLPIGHKYKLATKEQAGEIQQLKLIQLSVEP